MFCPNCGQMLPDTARFCPNCGAPIIGSPKSSFSQAMKDASKAVNEAADAVSDKAEKTAERAADASGKVMDHISEFAGTAADAARESLNEAADSIDAAVTEVERDLGGNNHNDSSSSLPLRTDRSLVAYILLSLVTCGIYGYYFIYTIARDINIACEDDDEETPGLGVYILLSFISCGFYSLYWEYKLANRLAKNGSYFGVEIQENGTTILLWKVIGSLICGIGYLVGSYILIRNVNTICEAYNNKRGL